LAKPLVRNVEPEWGYIVLPRRAAVPGRVGRVWGPKNGPEVNADKIRQQSEKLPTLCEAFGVVHGSPEWQTKLIFAMATDVCPGFDYPTKGPERGDGSQERYHKKQKDLAQIVRLKSINPNLSYKAVMEELEKSGWDCYGAIKGRFYNVAMSSADIIDRIGAEQINLANNGALAAFTNVPRLLLAMDKMDGTMDGEIENERILGILGDGAIQNHSYAVGITILHDPRTPLLASLLQEYLEAGGARVILKTLDDYPEDARKRMLAAARCHEGLPIIIDEPGNMQSATIMAEGFSRHGLTVPVVQNIGEFKDFPWRCIVALCDVPEQLHAETDGYSKVDPLPGFPMHSVGLFGGGFAGGE